MKRPRMRPTFALVPDVAPEEVFERMRGRLERPECAISGLVGRRHAELTTCCAGRHFWSPVMSVEIYEAEGGKSGLRGRFAPHPSVWMGFMAVYGGLFMAGVVSAMFGFSQWQLGWTPWAFAGVPIAAAIAAFTYGAAFIGQGLGAEEMYALRSFLDRCIEDLPELKCARPDSSYPPRTVTVTRTGAVRYE